MNEWTLRDTLGIVIVLGAILTAASAVDGVAQAIVALVGAVVALLWIANFFLRGYTAAVENPARGD